MTPTPVILPPSGRPNVASLPNEHQMTHYDWRRAQIDQRLSNPNAVDRATWEGRRDMSREDVANNVGRISQGDYSPDIWRARIAQAGAEGHQIPAAVTQSDPLLIQHGAVGINTQTGRPNSESIRPAVTPSRSSSTSAMPAAHTMTHEDWRKAKINQAFDAAKRTYDNKRVTPGDIDEEDDKKRYKAIMDRWQKLKDDPSQATAYTKQDHARLVAQAMADNQTVPDNVKAEHPSLATPEGRAVALASATPVDSTSRVGGTMGTDGTVKYGPSQATVKIVGNENRVKEAIKKLFGNNGTLQDIASCMGAPKGVEIKVSDNYDGGITARSSGTLLNDDGSVRKYTSGSQMGKPIVISSLNRTFRIERDGSKAIHNDLFERVGAGEDYNGYYTWPRFGYNAPLSNSADKLMKEHFPQAKTIADVFKTQEGRDLWMLHGRSIHGPDAVFDLKKNSRSQRDLAKYEASNSGGSGGFGREIFSRQVENATKHGFSQIDTHAAGGGPARYLTT